MKQVRYAFALAAFALAALAPVSALAAPGPQTGDEAYYVFAPDSGGARVNVVTGNLLVTDTDLADSSSTYHVTYGRAYNSLSPATSLLGAHWNLSAGPEVHLAVSGATATFIGPTGEVAVFTEEPDGSFNGPIGFDGALATDANGSYVMTRFDGSSFTFDANGSEVATTDAAGRAFTVTNTSAAGKTVLSSYGTVDGRRINVSYNGHSRVREVDDPASGHHLYGYNATGELASVDGPSGTAQFSYNADGLLTGASYPDGRSISVTPLSDGRTQSLTTHAADGSTSTYAFAYHSTYTVETLPGGAKRTYVFDSDGRVFRVFEGEDVTPPNAPSGLDATYDADSTNATVTWDAANDLQPDGSAGIGVASYRYRYRLGTGDFSAWSETTVPAFTVPQSFAGQSITVEVSASDFVGNESATTSQVVTADVPDDIEYGDSYSGESGAAPMDSEPADLQPDGDAQPMSRIQTAAAAAASDEYTENNCPGTDAACGTYNTSHAVAFAEKWKNVQDAGHADGNYQYLGGAGGDCTNWASQILKAGGFRYMRANGRNEPIVSAGVYGSGDFMRGEGSWWSVGTEHAPFRYDYRETASWIRSGTLHDHLLDYGLARRVTRISPKYVHAGDLVFYNLKGLTPDWDHTQIVTRVTKHSIYVVQHSPGYEHTLHYVYAHRIDGRPGVDFRVDVLHPVHTTADLPQ